MLAELRLSISLKEARLTLVVGDKVVEDDLWTFDRKATKKEAQEIIDAAFHDSYDLIQYAVHGDP